MDHRWPPDREGTGSVRMDDEELMMQAAAGDLDAFEEVVRRHQQDALNVAYRFLADQTLAEDVVQDAFLKVLASARRYRPTARFRTYLYTIVWHLCVDVHRRKRSQPIESLPVRQDPAPGPAQAAQDAERAALVRQAVQELSPRQRMALVLKHFENLSYAEIGHALECSPTAVDALLVRAKRRLKQRLKHLL